MSGMDHTSARGSFDAQDVSLVIPSFRSRSTIGATLKSVVKLEPAAGEVIVVDSSDDGSDEWIRRFYPRVRLVHRSNRLFAGQARNLGVEKSSGRLIAFLDADVEVEPGWLRTLLGALELHEEIRLIGAAVSNSNPQTAVSRVLYRIEFSEFLPGRPSGFLDALSSSNLLLRRRDFDRWGGFDESAAMSEDQLLCRRLKGGIYLETSTTVGHLHRESWEEASAHLRALGYWSGRFRSSQSMRGSGLRYVPRLSVLLAPFRLQRIFRRAWRYDPEGRRTLISDTPLLLRGLVAWCRGFRRGIEQSSSDPD